MLKSHTSSKDTLQFKKKTTPHSKVTSNNLPPLLLYSWQGFTKEGVKESGFEIGYKQSEIKQYLREQGIFVIQIKQSKHKGLFSPSLPKLALEQQAQMTKQWFNLLNAGVPLPLSLKLMLKQKSHRAEYLYFRFISRQLAAGFSLGQTIEQIPQAFGSLFCQLIALSEQTGKLIDTLEQLIKHQEAKLKLQRQLKQALTYPATLLVISVLILLFIFVVILPKFEIMYQQNQLELPLLTSWLLIIGKMIQTHSISFIILNVIGLKICHMIYCKNANVKYKLDKCKLKTPFIKDFILLKYSLLFCTTMGLSLKFNLPLLIALKQNQQACSNLYLYKSMAQVIDEVNQGISLYTSISKQKWTPILLQDMIAQGEQSSELSPLLLQLASYYEEALQQRLVRIIAFIEPCFLVLSAIGVGMIIFALYLPLFDLARAF